MKTRKFLSILTTLGLLITMAAFTAGPVSADTTQSPTTCYPVTPLPRACLFENAEGGGDRLTTNQSIGNLANISHTLSGTCNAPYKIPADDWNDCISSVKIWLPYKWHLCLYRTAGYANPMEHWAGNNTDKSTRVVLFDLRGSSNDVLSSLRFHYGALSPDGNLSTCYT